MISLEHVSKKYVNTLVLDDISYQFPSTGIVGLIGPNGSGKTTLLRLIAGLRKPTKGKILINKKIAITLDRDEYYPFSLRELGLCYQQFFEDFNYQFYISLLLENKLDSQSQFTALSKGQQTYTIIALTIARDVDIYLLDEPFSGLDLMIRQKITEKIIQCFSEKKLVILSSHDINHVERIFDNILTIKDRKLTAHTYEEVYQFPNLKDFYKSIY